MEEMEVFIVCERERERGGRERDRERERDRDVEEEGDRITWESKGGA